MKKVYIRKWMVALLLFVVGVVGLYMCYNNMYLPAVAEKERAEKNIDLLELRIATAKGNLSQEGYYAEEAEKVKADTEALKETVKMPGQILEEDQILFIRDLERLTEQKQMQIAFGADSKIFSVGSLVLNEKTFPYSYSLPYDKFKELITYLVEKEDTPMSLVSLTIAYDPQTKNVTGTMILRRYYVTGLEEYVPPVIPGIQVGTDTILG
jgi:hypothetical protein